MTHVRRSEFDTGLHRELVVEVRTLQAEVVAATEEATAHHSFDACIAHRYLTPLVLLCERSRSTCMAHVGSNFELVSCVISSLALATSSVRLVHDTIGDDAGVGTG